MRYPVLWEQIAPQGPETADWTWADERLGLLRQHGIDPVAGFVHHGSGPTHTSLDKPCFVEGLKAYARAFAGRYPWVEYYTPVNEPLTTARFSGLYGHWYPHGRDGFTFAQCLLNQCRATVECMRAIREINPAAKLVQTEDLGKTYSTPLLAYQADSDNERRWLSLDLLTGTLSPDRPMWGYLRAFGVTEAELQWFIDNPLPPDVIGINHYPTSERYLDENRAGYPEWSHGGNEYHAYADIEAVRVRHEGATEHYAGHYTLLKETWQRYGLPIAVTEVHICGPREEQLRWLQHAFRMATKLREEGVNVCAITAWSLLGTYDWINLVTRNEGFYEPGVFDVRGPEPRPTALAALLTALARGQKYHHPLLDQPGWWQRPDRFCYPFPPGGGRLESGDKYAFGNGTAAYWDHHKNPYCPVDLDAANLPLAEVCAGPYRPVLITGATGTLGKTFARQCAERKIPYCLLGRGELDITDAAAIERVFDQIKPWAVINAAGYACVERAEMEPDACLQANAVGSVLLATAAAERGIRVVTFSSDSVFNGRKRTPYVESDPVSPLGAHGRSKVQAEAQVLGVHPEALIVRAGAFFGPWDGSNSLTRALRQLLEGQRVTASDDRVHSPAYLPDLVHACLDLLVDGESGLWHLSSPGAVTPAAMLRGAAEMMGLDSALVRNTPPVRGTGGFGFKRNTVLDSERGHPMPTLEDALGRYCQDVVLKGVKQA